MFFSFQVINRAGNRPPPNRPGGHFDNFNPGGGGVGRQITHEMLIPGAKCGLVIGKGGETIKNIQVFYHRFLAFSILFVFSKYCLF